MERAAWDAWRPGRRMAHGPQRRLVLAGGREGRASHHDPDQWSVGTSRPHRGTPPPAHADRRSHGRDGRCRESRQVGGRDRSDAVACQVSERFRQAVSSSQLFNGVLPLPRFSSAYSAAVRCLWPATLLLGDRHHQRFRQGYVPSAHYPFHRGTAVPIGGGQGLDHGTRHCCATRLVPSMTSRRPRWAPILVVVALAASIVAVSLVREPVLRAAGWALIVNEPVAPADIIVIVPGIGGAGALEAADLVQSGIATRVAVFADPPSGEDHEFIRRGLPYEDAAARQIDQLKWLGVTDVVPIPRADTETEGVAEVL